MWKPHIYFPFLPSLLVGESEPLESQQAAWEMSALPHPQESDPVACKWDRETSIFR